MEYLGWDLNSHKILTEDSLTIGSEEEGTIKIHFQPFGIERFEITTDVSLIDDDEGLIHEDSKMYTVSSVADFIFLVLTLYASGYFDIVFSRPDAFDLIRKIPSDVDREKKLENKHPKLDRFCSIKYAKCNVEVNYQGSDSYFLAFPFDKDNKWPRLMTDIKEGFTKKELSAVLPKDKIEDISETGILFCNICRKILSTNYIIGETTTHNRNVMFEIGYAMGVGRESYQLVETGIERKEIKNFDLKRIDYLSLEDILNEFSPHILKKELDVIRAPTITNSCCDKKIIELEKSVFLLIPDNIKHQTVIKPALEKKIQDLGYIITPQTSGHVICNTCESIRKSEVIIGDYVSDNTIDREILNIKVAFYLGLSLALGKKVITLQEKPHDRGMIDMGGLIKEYVDFKEAMQIVHANLSPSQKGY